MTRYALVMTLEADQDLDNLYEDGLNNGVKNKLISTMTTFLPILMCYVTTRIFTAQSMKSAKGIAAVFAVNIQFFIVLLVKQ